jgi:pimeloyl-ACP methyl ester carboxylesterase
MEQQHPHPPPTLESTQGKIRKVYVDSQIGQLHVRYVAPPITERRHRPLVLFGASPASGKVYHELLLELGVDRLALTFDNPSAGESAAPSEPFDHPSQMAELFAAALLSLGCEVVDTFGNHSGAIQSLALAAYYPKQVAHVAVSGVPYIRDGQERAKLRARYPTIETIEPFKALHDRSLNFVVMRPPGLAFARAIELYVDGLSAGVRMNWLIRNSYAEGAEAWLTQVQAPVLFLQTENTLRGPTLDASALVPNKTIRERRDLDHSAFTTRPGEVAKELRAAFD